MSNNEAHTYTLSIAGKDWRARRGVLYTLAGASLAGFLLWFGWIMNANWGIKALPKTVFTLSWGYLFISMILGGVLWSSEEHDPARGFIYMLPISRARLLWLKLLALGSSLGFLAILWLAMLGLIIFIEIGENRSNDYLTLLIITYIIHGIWGMISPYGSGCCSSCSCVFVTKPRRR